MNAVCHGHVCCGQVVCDGATGGAGAVAVGRAIHDVWAGVEVENVILNSYASSIATMNEDEKELGVAVVDMGGNTWAYNWNTAGVAENTYTILKWK